MESGAHSRARGIRRQMPRFTSVFPVGQYAGMRDIDWRKTTIAMQLGVCLINATEHSLTNDEIYSWYKRNLPDYTMTTTWRHSLSHDLSNNEAFVKMTRITPMGRQRVWHLTDSAIEEGIYPTASYRDRTESLDRRRRKARALSSNATFLRPRNGDKSASNRNADFVRAAEIAVRQQIIDASSPPSDVASSHRVKQTTSRKFLQGEPFPTAFYVQGPFDQDSRVSRLAEDSISRTATLAIDDERSEMQLSPDRTMMIDDLEPDFGYIQPHVTLTRTTTIPLPHAWSATEGHLPNFQSLEESSRGGKAWIGDQDNNTYTHPWLTDTWLFGLHDSINANGFEDTSYLDGIDMKAYQSQAFAPPSSVETSGTSAPHPINFDLFDAVLNTAEQSMHIQHAKQPDSSEDMLDIGQFLAEFQGGETLMLPLSGVEASQIAALDQETRVENEMEVNVITFSTTYSSTDDQLSAPYVPDRTTTTIATSPVSPDMPENWAIELFDSNVRDRPFNDISRLSADAGGLPAGPSPHTSYEDYHEVNGYGDESFGAVLGARNDSFAL